MDTPSSLCLEISTYFSDELTIRNTSIEELILLNGLSTQGKIVLKNTFVSTIIMSKFKNDGQILFQDVSCAPGKMNKGISADFPFNSKHFLPKEKIKGNIIINRSDLGEARFMNLDFDSYDLIIRHSDLVDIRTRNNHLPVRNIYTGDNRQQNPLQLSELYNQLYLAMQKQGNKAQ